MTVMPAPLYRYPYRNSAEAFRGDWGRIGKDIEFVLEESNNSTTNEGENDE